ncbi:4-coumarate--CoA ligase-like 6 isoform X2 [Ananas comosus]|uniref:4-coumarate--CoA ligase n=1 Tax=Ananas comosus TaxID=4615 RepID=A0A6P5FBX1_ANACO|nr:4-coumarate--CoA ligase-like 6 isoform X2 [Ananas comosus]
MEGAMSNRVMSCCVSPNEIKNPAFFSPRTGIYSSKHAPRTLPQNPFLDLVSFLFSHEHQGEIALVDSRTGFSISYKMLRELVDSVASGLQTMGICSKDVVLILLPNSVLFPVILLGVLSIGAVVTTMNSLSSIDEIRKQMRFGNSKLAFTSLENIEKIENLGVLHHIVAVPEDLNYDKAKFPLFDRLISSNSKIMLKPIIHQSDTAAILYSSGTSGLSKGVVITHRNLISMVELFVRFEASQYENKSWNNVYLAALPMFHVYGLSLFTMGLLSLGSTIVVMRRFDMQEAIRAIEKYKVTHFPVVPPILGALVRAKSATGCKLESLMQISSGAAPLSRKVIQDFLRAFPHIDFIQGYGMTESTAVGTRGFNSGGSDKKYKSVGLLAPNMQAKVIDLRSGSCLPPGYSGELWLHGPAIMKGYLNDEDATVSTIVENGWLRTGDLAYFDQDGYLFVMDRLKDTIKYKGFQIAPADLEALLIAHPDILDVTVTSAADEEAGEIPVAFVVRKPGSSLSSGQVIEFVAKQFFFPNIYFRWLHIRK